jgi:hypothetical protein
MRVSESDQAAFKAEVKTIRKTLRALKKDRLAKFYKNGRPGWERWCASPEQVAAHRAKLIPPALLANCSDERQKKNSCTRPVVGRVAQAPYPDRPGIHRLVLL